MNQSLNISAYLDLIRSMSVDATLYSSSSLGSCIFNIVNCYKEAGEKLPYRGFIKLLECNDIQNIKMDYQQFRYLYNLGYLNNFCDNKLFCNSLRKASSIKSKLVNLNHDDQTAIKGKVSVTSLITLSTLESWIKTGSKDIATQNIEFLKINCEKHVLGSAGIIQRTNQLPSGFCVNLTEEQANILWTLNLKDKNPEDPSIKEFIIRFSVLYNTLVFLSGISGVMNQNHSVFDDETGEIANMAMYQSCKALEKKTRTNIVKEITSHFLTVFTQAHMSNIRAVMVSYSNQLHGSDGRNFTELFLASLDNFRRIEQLELAARPFF